MKADWGSLAIYASFENVGVFWFNNSLYVSVRGFNKLLISCNSIVRKTEFTNHSVVDSTIKENRSFHYLQYTIQYTCRTVYFFN